MSQIVRRLTAAVLLAAILAMAAPAGAAASARPHSPQAPRVLGTGLLDQVFSWLGSLWFGCSPAAQEKAMSEPTPTETGTDNGRPVESERGAMVDPNG